MKKFILSSYVLAISCKAFCCETIYNIDVSSTPEEIKNYTIFQMKSLDPFLINLQDQGYKTKNIDDYLVGYWYGKKAAYYEISEKLSNTSR